VRSSLASLATRTGPAQGTPQGRDQADGPMSTTVLAFLTSPVAGDTAPGIPTPMVALSDPACALCCRAPGGRWMRLISS